MSNENPDLHEENQQTIFSESEFSNEGYDKHIRQARNTLFILAILQLLVGIYSFAISDQPTGIVAFLITCFIAAVFAVLGFWTKKKPYTAIIIALVIYLLLWIGDCIVDPTLIFRGIILKVAVIIYLVKGLSDAKEAQQLKNALGRG